MKFLIFLLLLIGFHKAVSQNDCATKPKGKPIIYTQKKIDSINAISAINIPYTVKVFITVFANDNGQSRADDNVNILNNFQYMANVYRPHNICFILGGIRQINNTDLNDQSVSTEEAELNPYIVPGFLNIFIHSALYDGSLSFNGNAYGIPNTYLSLHGINYNIATMGHEMGHCLGLFHTFRNTGEGGVNENVSRAGNCKNCETAGDYLCDTPADDNGGVDVNCIYVGTGRDACSNSSFSPLTNNMMTYGNFVCRNAFTLGQANVMRATLIDNSTIKSLVAQDSSFYPAFFNETISSGTGYMIVRDLFLISSNAALTINGTANYQIQAKKVSLKAGTKFAPSAGGKISIRSNPYCN